MGEPQHSELLTNLLDAMYAPLSKTTDPAERLAISLRALVTAAAYEPKAGTKQREHDLDRMTGAALGRVVESIEALIDLRVAAALQKAKEPAASPG